MKQRIPEITGKDPESIIISEPDHIFFCIMLDSALKKLSKTYIGPCAVRLAINHNVHEIVCKRMKKKILFV